MNISEYKQSAKLIRDTEVYKVFDLASLKRLNVSLTELYSAQSTSGHSHDNADEVYIFFEGDGIMEVGNKTFPVKAGDLMLVPSGNFHKVHNKGEKNLSFWAIFEKYEGRGM